MKLSHLHIGLKDLNAAVVWFRQIFDLSPVEHIPGMAVYRFDDVDIVIHEGAEDIAMTIALKCTDCKKSYADALLKGAQARTPPRDKGGTIGADVFGPGRLVIEFDETYE